MSGHSKWANIQHRKGRQDEKRTKMFTKLGREIAVAAKLGDPNPDFNPRLRNAVIAARAQNMPKDRIESIIKKVASGTDSSNYEEIRYEGYGANGVAVIVEALTDNKNRTAASVRSIFTKAGGNLGETRSVSFMFERVGIIGYEGKVATEDEMFEAVIEAGAESVESSEDYHEIITKPEDFIKVRDTLMAKYGDPADAKLTWKAKDPVTIDDLEKAQKIMKLVDNLEDDDDVQNVIGAFEISDDIMEKL